METYRCDNGHAGPWRLTFGLTARWSAAIDSVHWNARVLELQEVDCSGAVWILACEYDGCNWAAEAPREIDLVRGTWEYVVRMRPPVRHTRPKRERDET